MLSNKYIQNIQNKIIKQKDSFQKYFILGYFRYYKDDLKNAKTYFEKAMNYIEDEKNLKVICYNSKFLMKYWAFERNYEKANEVFKKTCNYIPKKQYVFLYEPMMDMARYLSVASRKSEIGMKALDDIVKNIANLTDGINLCKYNSYYQIYRVDKSYAREVNYLLKAIKLSESLDDEFLLSRLICDLGAVYYELRDYKNAEEAMQRAFNIMKKYESKNIFLKNYILMNLVELYMDLEKYDKALEKGQQIKYVQKLNKMITSQDLKNMIDIIKSNIYIQKKQLNSAEKLLYSVKEKIVDKKKINMLYTYYYYNLALGNLNLARGENKQAIIYYKQAEEISEKEYVKEIKLLDKIADVYHQLGDEKSRANYQQLLVNLYNKNELSRNKENRDYLINHLEKEGELIKSGKKQLFFYKSLSIVTIIVFLIISFLVRKLRQLKKQNIVDGLTSVYNRKYFDFCYNKAILKKENISIIMIDIDDFKKINDTYGHSTGDLFIKTTAKIIKNLLDKEDLVFRYGGEEFCVLIKNKDIHEVIELAENIRMFTESIKLKEKLKVTLSLGIGFTNKGEDALKLADENLYKAKNTGKNKVVFK
ncbi:GTP cyclohydrolase IIa [Romboutsia maritimum]|uniref:GTP cyclohydrolase IIa n=1 Tax=Romboutsia maritimum TaxID=2020948 RepID=A0A371ITK6_9FIRM|nr:GGDEF domain-containing protein [Romboutsia maritimum]RDY23810.1 GTP cyclohydrolase IIa [Romboutsia maritimum]